MFVKTISIAATLMINSIAVAYPLSYTRSIEIYGRGTTCALATENWESNVRAHLKHLKDVISPRINGSTQVLRINMKVRNTGSECAKEYTHHEDQYIVSGSVEWAEILK